MIFLIDLKWTKLIQIEVILHSIDEMKSYTLIIELNVLVFNNKGKIALFTNHLLLEYQWLLHFMHFCVEENWYCSTNKLRIGSKI